VEVVGSTNRFAVSEIVMSTANGAAVCDAVVGTALSTADPLIIPHQCFLDSLHCFTFHPIAPHII
jgi:hypothetical protein